MGIFRKQTVRAPWTTVLLVLLLALSIAASSIGFTAWVGAGKQLEQIDSQYTTIAIPSAAGLERMDLEGTTSYFGSGSMVLPDGTRYISPFDAELTAKLSDDYVRSDRRVYLSAHVENGLPLSSGTNDPLQYNYRLDQYCYQMSVLALRCVEVEPLNYDWISERGYQAKFEILDAVCRIDAYDLPPYEDFLHIESSLFTQDGEIPFEPGNSYLVRGFYWDYDVFGKRGEPVRDISGVFKKRTLLMDPQEHLRENPRTKTGLTSGLPNLILERRKDPSDGMFYYVTPETDCWPYYAEYSGSWEEYLDTEAGAVWKDEIIPYVQANHSSVPVILTDDIMGMYYFNTGDASILEGALFTPEQYADGDAVCLVSAAYAARNDLGVGDTVELEFYHPGYSQELYNVLQGTGRTGLTIVRQPLSERTRMDVKKTYTITGIYTAPQWQAGAHSFHADTFFVPKASVPNADRYAGATLSMLNTVIIKNGSIDAFEGHMAESGKAGAYIYFDQGYSEAAATVQTLIDNAMRLMIVGVAMFLLASMLFLLLFARRVAAVMRSMRLLGVPKKGVWLESLGILVVQELIAVLLGNGLAVILYDRITAQLLSGTPTLDITAIALCAGVQLALLITVGGVWMYRIAGRNLMHKSEGGNLLWKRNNTASCGA